MTVVSTVVAVAVMPALLLLYAAPWTSAQFQLPLGNIVTTLALVLVPVAIGVFIRARSERTAARIERLGAASGVVVLVLLVGSSLVRNHGDLARIPLAGYAAAITLGLLGMVLGYAASRALGMTAPQRRAVALETGIQNSPLAFALILAAFDGPEQSAMLWLPMLYALFVLVSASVATLWFRRNLDAT